MQVPFVDLKAQYESIKGDIDDAVQSILNQSLFVGGEVVSQFEIAFASYLGVRNCIGVANGTDALEISLKALDIGPGDEVIVPALSWISTASAVNNVGAEPVFVDVLADERTINSELVAEKITENTKAIIPVHLYGLPARMHEICEVAKKYGLKVIEDCAQAHGAEINGKKVGTFGDLSVFSFYPSKNLGAFGDAGAIVTDSERLKEKCRLISNLGQPKKNDHVILGRNSRLDALQAAVLKVKLAHLDNWIKYRNEVAKWYNTQLGSVVKPLVPEGLKHVYHLYVIQSPRRDDLMNKLREGDIGYALHYPTPLPHLKSYAYKTHVTGDFPNAEKLCAEVLSLPMYAELTEEEVEQVSEVLLNA